MVVYSLKQRWEMLKYYFENNGNVAECVRKLRADFGREEAQGAPYVRYFVNKVEETSLLINKPTRIKQPTKRTPENVNAGASRHQAQELN